MLKMMGWKKFGLSCKMPWCTTLKSLNWVIRCWELAGLSSQCKVLGLPWKTNARTAQELKGLSPLEGGSDCSVHKNKTRPIWMLIA